MQLSIKRRLYQIFHIQKVLSFLINLNLINKYFFVKNFREEEV